ncbi:octaprenyl-diphosphate synthase domain protein [Rickettsia felis str. Pedreira]|uniref:Octaprenyl-diphosphate synthase domain protein n=1 Tax=Rickettsia felis str. Pedreira TaxID=1359196 RepID=A0A0F3MQ22_RICFI|nr:octaprenyl-diphosphate synthase domain protein [Rickettsia felis str. Pedreira]
MDTKPSLRATERSTAISGLWHEIASSKLTVFPRNDEKTVTNLS